MEHSVISVEGSPELYDDFFYLSEEVSQGGGAAILFTDEIDDDDINSISTIEIADCIAIAIWGMTADGKHFIGLIHKQEPDLISGLLKENNIDISTATIGYRIIPGKESTTYSIKDAEEQCEELWTTLKQSTEIPDEITIGTSGNQDKSSVAIRKKPGKNIEILIVRPKTRSYRYAPG